MNSINMQNKLIAALMLTALLQGVSATELSAQNTIPDGAKPWPHVGSERVSAVVDGKKLWLKLDETTLSDKKVVVPRLCAPIRSISWLGQPDADLAIRPAQKEWTLSWKSAPTNSSVIEITFDSNPLSPRDCPVAVPAGDGSVMLHAWQAKTFGEKILFEPQWYKNTVGYWAIASDYATWDLKIDQPGTYTIAMLQGCGDGQGGSDAVVSLRQDGQVKAELPFQTIDTGHFQNFRWNHLGLLELKEPGTYQLRIDAKRIAKVALFDVRAIHLVRQADVSMQK